MTRKLYFSYEQPRGDFITSNWGRNGQYVMISAGRASGTAPPETWNLLSIVIRRSTGKTHIVKIPTWTFRGRTNVLSALWEVDTTVSQKNTAAKKPWAQASRHNAVIAGIGHENVAWMDWEFSLPLPVTSSGFLRGATCICLLGRREHWKLRSTKCSGRKSKREHKGSGQP